MAIDSDSGLTFEEVYCLQQSGMTTPEIMRTDLDAFERLYDNNQEQFDVWLEKAERLFDRQETLGIKTITCQDADYPSRLKAIGTDAPPMIHLLGNTSLLKRRGVAVIGARSADRMGLEAAYQLGMHYANEGDVVISGLALGCDTMAHKGCLDAGGETIAIVATGLDITHPLENRYLQDRILRNGGLLLSEQLVGTKANPTRLVARNRLQAALSHSVVLAQSPEKGGSMHTMRFGQRYGKNLLAAKFRVPVTLNGGNNVLIEHSIAEPIEI